MDKKQKAEAFEKAIASIVDKVWPTVEADLKKAMEEENTPEDDKDDEEKKDEEKKEEEVKSEDGEEVKDEEKKDEDEEKKDEENPQGDEKKLEKLAAAFDEDKKEEDEDEKKEVEDKGEEKEVEKADEEVVEEKKDEEKKDEEKKDEENPFAEKAMKQIADLQKSVAALTERLEKVAHSPASVRKSVDGKAVAKSGADAPKDITTIKKAAIKNAMVELMTKGEIRGEEVTRFELTGRIADADVRKKVLKSLNK